MAIGVLENAMYQERRSSDSSSLVEKERLLEGSSLDIPQQQVLPRRVAASGNYGNRRNKPITQRDRKCVRNVALGMASTSP